MRIEKLCKTHCARVVIEFFANDSIDNSILACNFWQTEIRRITWPKIFKSSLHCIYM